MNTYKKYKKSKFKWFSDVPFDWKEGRISYLFNIGRGRVISELELNPDGVYPVYSSQTKNDGCLGYIDTFDFDDKILTWTTDGANAGSVFLREGKFNCTNVCGTLSPKIPLDLKYYLYYLQAITIFYKRPDTNGAKIMNNEMAAIYCLAPAIQEQTQIAQYLDYQTGIIDELIKKKEKLIELLKEKRQSIINEAVTKGLNPKAKMKESGIEWLGLIPYEWVVSRIGFVADLITGFPWKSELFDFESGIKIVRGENVSEGFLRWGDRARFWKQEVELDSKYFLNENDIVIAMDGSKVGKNYVLITSTDLPLILHQRMCRLRVRKGIHPQFIAYYISSNMFRYYIDISKTDPMVPHITQKNIFDFELAIPSFAVQQSIVDYLDEKNATIHSLIFNVKNQIEKLKEYRQSLISEAVTGKIDLREWQPNNK